MLSLKKSPREIFLLLLQIIVHFENDFILVEYLMLFVLYMKVHKIKLSLFWVFSTLSKLVTLYTEMMKYLGIYEKCRLYYWKLLVKCDWRLLISWESNLNIECTASTRTRIVYKLQWLNPGVCVNVQNK